MRMIFLHISPRNLNGKGGKMKTQPKNHVPHPNVFDEKIGKIFWFEYRFFDSVKSYNPELWFRSHQQVVVISIAEPGLGKTISDRTESGASRFYNVKFEDGCEHKVSEDELLDSKDDFYTIEDNDNQ